MENPIEKKCVVCDEQLKPAFARLLNCLHFICTPCLHTVAARGPIECPACGDVTLLLHTAGPVSERLPTCPASLFPGNTTTIQRTAQDPRLCNFCLRKENAEALHVCEQCNGAMFCAGHSDAHMKLLPSHTLTDIACSRSKNSQQNAVGGTASGGKRLAHLKYEAAKYCVNCKSIVSTSSKIDLSIVDATTTANEDMATVQLMVNSTEKAIQDTFYGIRDRLKKREAALLENLQRAQERQQKPIEWRLHALQGLRSHHCWVEEVATYLRASNDATDAEVTRLGQTVHDKLLSFEREIEAVVQHRTPIHVNTLVNQSLLQKIHADVNDFMKIDEEMPHLAAYELKMPERVIFNSQSVATVNVKCRATSPTTFPTTDASSTSAMNSTNTPRTAAIGAKKKTKEQIVCTSKTASCRAPPAMQRVNKPTQQIAPPSNNHHPSTTPQSNDHRPSTSPQSVPVGHSTQPLSDQPTPSAVQPLHERSCASAVITSPSGVKTMPSLVPEATARTSLPGSHSGTSIPLPTSEVGHHCLEVVLGLETLFSADYCVHSNVKFAPAPGKSGVEFKLTEGNTKASLEMAVSSGAIFGHIGYTKGRWQWSVDVSSDNVGCGLLAVGVHCEYPKDKDNTMRSKHRWHDTGVAAQRPPIFGDVSNAGISQWQNNERLTVTLDCDAATVEVYQQRTDERKSLSWKDKVPRNPVVYPYFQVWSGTVNAFCKIH